MTDDPTFVKRRAPALYVIVAIKCGKAILLALLAFGFFSLIGQDIDARFDTFLRWIHVDPEQQFFAELGNHLQKITPYNLRWLASGSLIYAVLLLTESAGLIRRSWWAVWLAIGETAFFIPIEVFDLLKHYSGVITVVLVLNAVIVVYLVRNRERLFHHHRPHSPPAGPGRPSAAGT